MQRKGGGWGAATNKEVRGEGELCPMGFDPAGLLSAPRSGVSRDKKFRMAPVELLDLYTGIFSRLVLFRFLLHTFIVLQD